MSFRDGREGAAAVHGYFGKRYVKWEVCVCVCNLLFINRYMRPGGPWQRLAAAHAGSSGIKWKVCEVRGMRGERYVKREGVREA